MGPSIAIECCASRLKIASKTNGSPTSLGEGVYVPLHWTHSASEVGLGVFSQDVVVPLAPMVRVEKSENSMPLVLLEFLLIKKETT